MKKWLTGIITLCIMCVPIAHADVIPYFDFTSASESVSASSPSPSPSPTAVPTASPTPALQLIEDFQIPLAPPPEDLMPEISAQPQGQGTAATVVPTPATTQTPSLYPQAILDALAKEGIVPEDVIDLEKWWITAKEGDQCAVAVGDCITVNSMFYMVVAECPPFEKSAGLTSFDMITLINFMAGFFVQMYP